MGGENGVGDRRRDRIDPLGHVLRTTFDADNHASLDGRTTALMLELSRLPLPDEQPEPAPPPQRTLWGRVRGLIGRAPACTETTQAADHRRTGLR